MQDDYWLYASCVECQIYQYELSVLERTIKLNRIVEFINSYPKVLSLQLIYIFGLTTMFGIWLLWVTIIYSLRIYRVIEIPCQFTLISNHFDDGFGKYTYQHVEWQYNFTPNNISYHGSENITICDEYDGCASALLADRTITWMHIKNRLYVHYQTGERYTHNPAELDDYQLFGIIMTIYLVVSVCYSVFKCLVYYYFPIYTLEYNNHLLSEFAKIHIYHISNDQFIIFLMGLKEVNSYCPTILNKFKMSASFDPCIIGHIATFLRAGYRIQINRSTKYIHQSSKVISYGSFDITH